MERNDDRSLLRKLDGFLYLLSAGMFIMTLLELWGLKHWDGIQKLPWIMCAVGVLLLIISWAKPSAGLNKILRVVMIVIMLSGLFGMFEHGEGNVEGEDDEGQSSLVLTAHAQETDGTAGADEGEADNDAESEAGEAETRVDPNASTLEKLFHGQNPLLAPGALTAAALTGLVAMETRVRLEDDRHTGVRSGRVETLETVDTVHTAPAATTRSTTTVR